MEATLALRCGDKYVMVITKSGRNEQIKGVKSKRHGTIVIASRGLDRGRRGESQSCAPTQWRAENCLEINRTIPHWSRMPVSEMWPFIVCGIANVLFARPKAARKWLLKSN
jgi:hypothetical protein